MHLISFLLLIWTFIEKKNTTNELSGCQLNLDTELCFISEQTDIWPIASWICKMAAHENSDTILDWAYVHRLLLSPEDAETAWESSPAHQFLDKTKGTAQGQGPPPTDPIILSRLSSWILAAAGTFSRFGLNILIYSTDLGHTLWALQEHICSLFGFPKNIASDDGFATWATHQWTQSRAILWTLHAPQYPKSLVWLSILVDN